ncbi:hypothetical protein ElyMa_003410100 [Elysia marginata]|uniref:Uncharacterized protein n=1 Tax=Elysia marginata TaxID=1093978 RepID=A0AAV4JN51_9GAST|nr:hypothetical protein ElyMa_003410100 [Elysia marginata]
MGHLHDKRQKVSAQIYTVTNSVKLVETNASVCKENVKKCETALDQWALTAKEEDKKLGGLTSGISLLSGLTQNLVSRFNTSSNSNADDKFSDPFHNGREEWKLVSRGTASTISSIHARHGNSSGGRGRL